jgi:hypothetical protein
MVGGGLAQPGSSDFDVGAGDGGLVDRRHPRKICLQFVWLNMWSQRPLAVFLA